MMEFMTAVNRLLHKSPNCRRRRLGVQCYAVTPLDQECGLIEWVPNVMPIRNLCKQYATTSSAYDALARPLTPYLAIPLT